MGGAADEKRQPMKKREKKKLLSKGCKHLSERVKDHTEIVVGWGWGKIASMNSRGSGARKETTKGKDEGALKNPLQKKKNHNASGPVNYTQKSKGQIRTQTAGVKKKEIKSFMNKARGEVGSPSGA